mmetsp:Transcript_43857/g.82272  ORF Transcript_43857/g.82272 Transcript_43857/m.82272 type:complete len:388 (+) Transcript_43857:38-1201(+)
MNRPRRTSLSDWWDRPDNGTSPKSGDSDMEVRRERDAVTPRRKEECDSLKASPPSSRFSPSKRGSPTFYIGDDEPDAQGCEASPRKKATTRASKGDINSAVWSALMKAPDLSAVLRNAEAVNAKTKDLCSALEKEVKRKGGEMQERVQAAEERVAALSEELRELKQSKQAAEERVCALSGELCELKTGSQAAEERVCDLRDELCQLKKTDCQGRRGSSAQGEESADIKNVKVAFAAGWEHMNKQLRQIRQQMQLLEERLPSAGLHSSTGLGPSPSPSNDIDDLSKSVGDRWPGRQLPSSTDAPSQNSDNDSDRLSTDSLAASATLDPEEKAELKKIRAILAAAGTAYSKDLCQVKNQMREMRAEMQEFRAFMNEHRACSKNAVEEII